MALYRCTVGGGSGVYKVVKGEFNASNTTDSEHDPKYITIEIPIQRKPKKFLLYRRNSASNGYRGSTGTGGTSDNSTTHTSVCYYDQSRSTTQYYVQSNDPNISSSLDTCKMYDIGSTYDWTPIRSITDSTITIVLKVAYTTSPSTVLLYGGWYHYWIFY